MSNSTNDTEFLNKLREDKIEVITKTDDYVHYKLNGLEMIEFIEDTNTYGVFHDTINCVLGSRSINPRNIYGVNKLAANLKKMQQRMEAMWSSAFKTHSNFRHSRDVLAILNKAAVRVEEDSKARIDSGVVTFEDLPFLFQEDECVTWEGRDEIQVGGYYKEAEFKSSWNGSYVSFDVEMIVRVGELITKARVSTIVPDFGGTMEISKLPIKRLIAGSKTEQELIARGEIFASVATGRAYAEYTGMLVKPSFWSDAEYRADGRIMVDPESMGRLDKETYNQAKRRIMSQKGYGNDDESEVKIEKVEEKDYFACSPYIMGFSFRSKSWGMMRVSGLKPINWAADAFERLVLDTKTKKRVRALVQNSSNSFSDIIGGKGGGCVFLLHGEPGQGKTLTAETVAEDLKRPLYSISVGELGTDPDQLERRLREILDLATVWNAVLLLDEADIFLEARDEKDVLRNAMVGVFLRLLEYHQGVLFLTTNRVRNIDRAFYSRISVAIAFTKADLDKRVKVWTNLLDAAGISINSEAIAQLAASNLNGRQVKNVIRTASTMAKLDGEAVNYARLADEIIEATRFERDMDNAPEYLTKTAAPSLKAAA